MRKIKVPAIAVENIRIAQYEHGGCRIYCQNGENRKLIVDGYIDADFSIALNRFVCEYFDSLDTSRLNTPTGDTQ